VSTLLLVLGLLAVVATGGLGAYLLLNRSALADAGGPQPTTTPTPEVTSAAATATPSPTPAPVPSYEMNGPRTYVFAAGDSAVFGTGGTLRTYRVAVETGVPVSPEEFAQAVDTTLSDPRSWTGGGSIRLQRIGGEASGTNFTIYLVTPGTARTLCLAAGYDIFWRGEPYSSCYTGRVLVNLSRYLKGIPDYEGHLPTYQQYVINHEVGHALGKGHELCPAAGQPAPVMQQQTFDMQGCTINAWPYLNGQLYSGPPGRIVPRD
jgi:hypothetical protein